MSSPPTKIRAGQQYGGQLSESWAYSFRDRRRAEPETVSMAGCFQIPPQSMQGEEERDASWSVVSLRPKQEPHYRLSSDRRGEHRLAPHPQRPRRPRPGRLARPPAGEQHPAPVRRRLWQHPTAARSGHDREPQGSASPRRLPLRPRLSPGRARLLQEPRQRPSASARCSRPPSSPAPTSCTSSPGSRSTRCDSMTAGCPRVQEK